MGCNSSSWRSVSSTDEPSVSATSVVPLSSSRLLVSWSLPSGLSVGFPPATLRPLFVRVFWRILARMSAHFFGSILCLLGVTLCLPSKRFLLWSVADAGPPLLMGTSLIGPRLLGFPTG